MKRTIAAIFLVLVLGGGFGLWWFLRDTPEKVLRDGFSSLISLKTAKTCSLDVSWTDIAARTTTGFSYSGQIDLKSWTRPRALGAIRIGAGAAEGQNQTGDIVIETDAVALRPRSVSPELRAYAESLSKDPSGETFLVLGRDAVLDDKGFAKAVSNAPGEDLKREAAFVVPALAPIGKLVQGSEAGRPTVTAAFRVDRKSITPVLLALVKVWMGDNLTPDEYGWVETVSPSLSSGNFELTLDKATRLPLRLKGTFGQIDASGVETRKISFKLALEGHNQKVSIGIPDKSKDVTETTILKKQTRAALPQARLRVLPGNATGTGAMKPGAAPTSTGKMIDEKETDLFDKYYEEMVRKKNQQY